MIATYVDNLNPVALPIYGELALRWYGLAYLMGFVCGFLLLRNLAKRGLWVLKPEQTGDFIAGAAMFGVFSAGVWATSCFTNCQKSGGRAWRMIR